MVPCFLVSYMITIILSLSRHVHLCCCHVPRSQRVAQPCSHHAPQVRRLAGQTGICCVGIGCGHRSESSLYDGKLAGYGVPGEHPQRGIIYPGENCSPVSLTGKRTVNAGKGQAIDYLLHLPQVDLNQLVVTGLGMGAEVVTTAAAFDSRIRMVVPAGWCPIASDLSLTSRQSRWKAVGGGRMHSSRLHRCQHMAFTDCPATTDYRDREARHGALIAANSSVCVRHRSCGAHELRMEQTLPPIWY